MGHTEYTRDNFFIALYLAHEIEEEREEDRWNLLPWALGKTWRGKVHHFVKAKNYLWQRMDFKAIVSAKACKQVFQIESFKKLKVFLRHRNDTHTQMDRIPIGDDKAIFIPQGPFWQTENGKDWLATKVAELPSTVFNCTLCDSNSYDMTSFIRE